MSTGGGIKNLRFEAQPLRGGIHRAARIQEEAWLVSITYRILSNNNPKIFQWIQLKSASIVVRASNGSVRGVEARLKWVGMSRIGPT
jgi:hypothetical protein